MKLNAKIRVKLLVTAGCLVLAGSFPAWADTGADSNITIVPAKEDPAAEVSRAASDAGQTAPSSGAEPAFIAPAESSQTNVATVKPPVSQKTESSGSGPTGTVMTITPISPGGGSGVVSAARSSVIAYAKQFLGNPYKFGGTSLTEGADCSGFTMSVFAHFGINTGRSSRDQALKGKSVDVADVQPGDLLFYASGDYINHVAIYIGNNQVIHASNERTGITISPADYREPYCAATFLD